MAIISNLIARLRADTSSFDKGMRSGVTSLRNFNGHILTTSRTIRNFTRGILVAAGIGGMGYMIKKTMESIDAIAKMSDELQISTKSLTGWQHAAKISGTSLENLHKGLEIFVRRIGEAKHGTGEAVKGFQMLNLSAKELIDMGSEEAFLTIAGRISEIQTAAEQAAVAYQFFGRQGVQLLNMFQQGRKGIEAMQEEAEKLGLTFSRFDARQVEEANDALTRSRAVLTGLIRRTTIEVAPFIEALANKFTSVATAGEGVGANVTKAFEYMSLGAIKFGEALWEIPLVLNSIKAGMYDVASFWEKLAGPVGLPQAYLRQIKGQKSPEAIADELRAKGEEQRRKAAEQISSIRKFFEDIRAGAKPQHNFRPIPSSIKWQRILPEHKKSLPLN